MPSTLGIVASGEDVFNDAVLWLDTARSVAGETTMVNYGKGGSALNATYGSSAGADTNDPLLLTHSGTNYLYLPGGSGNYASTPNAAVLQPSTQLEIVARVALDDWTPATSAVVVGKWTGASTPPALGRSYQLNVTQSAPAGRLNLQWSDSTATYSAFSTTVPTFSDGVAYWVKATLNTNTGSGYEVKFYTAADQATEPASWTQLGSTVTGTATGSIVYTTNVLEVGSAFGGTANLVIGKVYRAIVRNGIGGTTVFDADFTTGITSGGQATFTESSANAATVTINRSTSGRKAVAVVRNVLLFGTDDYLEVADNDLLDFGASDSFTAIAVVRQWNTPTSFGRTFGKLGASGAGWMMLNVSTVAQRYFSITDGTTLLNAGLANPYTVGALAVTSAVRNTAADNVTLYNGNSALTPETDTTVNTLANSSPLRVGAASAGGSFQDFELVAVAVWRRALSTNEIATVVARYA